MEIESPETKPETIKWKRIPLDKDLRRAVHAKSDLRGLWQAGGHLGLLVCTGVAAYYSKDHWPWWVTVLIVFFHGTCANFLLNGFHELVHGTVFKTRWLNTLFLNIYSFLGWHNPVFFWASHTEHHRYTLHPPRDLEVVLPVRYTLKGFLQEAFVSWGGIKWRFSKFARHIRGKVEGEWEEALFPDDEPEKKAAMVRWARIIVFGHLGITAVSLAFGEWMIPLLVSFSSFYGGWLLFLCNNTQHVGLSDNVPDFRLCCRTFRMNPFFEFLYWQMNYHTEHHMYAAVPCYRLKKLHKAIAGQMPETKRGLIPVWREIAGILKRQKEDPNYRYVPKLPEAG